MTAKRFVAGLSLLLMLVNPLLASSTVSTEMSDSAHFPFFHPIRTKENDVRTALKLRETEFVIHESFRITRDSKPVTSRNQPVTPRKWLAKGSAKANPSSTGKSIRGV